MKITNIKEARMVNEWISENMAAHIALLKELAAIPAPSGNEDKRVEYLVKLFEGMGVNCLTDEAKNVTVPFGEMRDGARDAVVFAAHTDVVFPDTAPLPVVERDGLLMAPGVGDDTANLAAIVTAIRYIKEKGLSPKRPVLFVFDSCEEGLGNLKGTRELFKTRGAEIAEFISFDCAFDEGIITRAVGSERWRVRAKARGGHSFMDFGNSSAIEGAARLVTRLYEQTVPQKENAHTTYNVGVISGGTSVNTIAETAELLYEYRSDDRACMDAMRESFMRILKEEEGEVAFAAELIGERPCGGEVDAEALEALISRCAAALREFVGEPIFGAGSTDSNIPLSLGIPAVTFGLYEGGGMHTRGEWLKLDSLEKGLKTAFRVILNEFE
jgi:acetylornithine deacetylase/succinyl-diaminopimelate desuccinylase-like protein